MSDAMHVDPARPFRHLCSEADLRDSMTDEEFWARVRDGWAADHRGPLHDLPIDAEDVPHLIPTPCPVCGGTGPCGYDPEGLPYIHVEETP